jgi:hypothetical protein
MTTVVNLRHERYDVYIGRPSPAGNPFVIGRGGSRSEVVEKYRAYFYHRLETDSEFRTYIHSLKDKALGCYCAPLDCHGHIIADYLNGLVI